MHEWLGATLAFGFIAITPVHDDDVFDVSFDQRGRRPRCHCADHSLPVQVFKKLYKDHTITERAAHDAEATDCSVVRDNIKDPDGNDYFMVDQYCHKNKWVKILVDVPFATATDADIAWMQAAMPLAGKREEHCRGMKLATRHKSQWAWREKRIARMLVAQSTPDRAHVRAQPQVRFLSRSIEKQNNKLRVASLVVQERSRSFVFVLFVCIAVVTAITAVRAMCSARLLSYIFAVAEPSPPSRSDKRIDSLRNVPAFTRSHMFKQLLRFVSASLRLHLCAAKVRQRWQVAKRTKPTTQLRQGKATAWDGDQPQKLVTLLDLKNIKRRHPVLRRPSMPHPLTTQTRTHRQEKAKSKPVFGISRQALVADNDIRFFCGNSWTSLVCFDVSD